MSHNSDGSKGFTKERATTQIVVQGREWLYIARGVGGSDEPPLQTLASQASASCGAARGLGLGTHAHACDS